MIKIQKTIISLAALTVFWGPNPRLLRAAENPVLPSALETEQFMENGIEKIKNKLSGVRLMEEDLSITSGWPLPHIVEGVESLFKKPLNVPRTSTHWASDVEFARKKSDVFKLTRKILEPRHKAKKTQAARVPPIPSGIPKIFHSVLRNSYPALKQAQRLVKEGAGSITPAAQQGLLSLYEWPNPTTGLVEEEISTQRRKKKYKDMEEFKIDPLLQAGEILSELIDELEPLLSKLSSTPLKQTIRWTTPIGVVVISGDEDNIYKEEDLQGAILFIDLGGDNTYTSPVAVANPGEIRVVLDLGKNILIKTGSNQPNAGVGVFGVGVLSLPNKEGVKTIEVDSFGQGTGIGGVGALFINGEAHLKGTRYIQGAGIFGVGYLRAEGNKNTYEAERNGQGLGMSRGVGIFHHIGNDGDVRGGLVEPDPREPQGATSLCQGVAFGSRAYAGGGVGMALVNGDGNKVTGSYFAQGVGYYYALGIFRLRGDRNILQARRYDLGSGVHFAFGHFQLFGNNNRVLNWGVGPSYGWDMSVGSSLIKGAENELQAEWGTGMASIGSYSFSYIEGDRNKLLLPQFGQGRFYRGRLAYSVQVLEGAENRAQVKNASGSYSTPIDIKPNLWGLFSSNALTFVPDLGLEKPIWENYRKETPPQRSEPDLKQKMAESVKEVSLEQKIGSLLDVASAFSVDKESPRRAMEQLFSLSDTEAAILVDQYEPADVGQLIPLMILLPAYGDIIPKTIIEKFNSFEPRKQAALSFQLSFHNPYIAIPQLLSWMNVEDTPSKDKSLGLRALGALARILNKDTGAEPGLWAFRKEVAKFLSRPKTKASEKEFRDFLYRMRGHDLYTLLNSILPLSTEDRLAVFKSYPEDLTLTLGPPTGDVVIPLLTQNQNICLTNLNETEAFLDETENKIRENLYELLKSTINGRVEFAVQTLGQLGYPEDFKKIFPLRNHDSRRIRESVAVAVGQFGETAVKDLMDVMDHGTSEEKILVLATLAHATSPKFSPLVKKGLLDPDAQVRLTAISSLAELSPSTAPDRPKFLKFVKKKLKSDPDPNVRLAVQIIK